MEHHIKNTEKAVRKAIAGYDSSVRKRPVPIEIEYKGKVYKGEGIPVSQTCKEKVCYELEVVLNDEQLGIIHCTDKGWKMKNVKARAWLMP